MRCWADNGERGGCAALEIRRCEGCKFRRSEMEYYLEQEKAAESLERRGLRVVRKRVERQTEDGPQLVQIVSTEPAREDFK